MKLKRRFGRSLPVVVIAALFGQAGPGVYASDCWIPSFQLIQEFTGPSTEHVSTADFDGNGLEDAAMLERLSDIVLHSSVHIFLNHAGTGFAFSQAIPIAGVPQGLVAGDWSGDGIPDLIAWSDSDGGAIQFLLNDGNGVFAIQPSLQVNLIAPDVDIVDLDSDGKPDVIATVSGGGTTWNNKLLWLKGDGAGGFTQMQIAVALIRSTDVLASDLDGDDDVDLFITTSSTGPQASVELNNGSEVFTSVQTLTNLQTRRHVTLANLNGDNRPDLVFDGFSAQPARAFLNNGSGSFTFLTDIPTSTSIQLHDIVAVDVNGDGLDDIFGWNAQNTLFMNSGGSFAQSIRIAQYSGLTVGAGQFDDQPGVDLLTNSGFQLQIWSNRGLGLDCNLNGIDDTCEIADGTQADCNRNTIPDSCEIADATGFDCNNDGVLDACQGDCNGNGIHDSCDLADGTLTDYNGNGVPDICDRIDCNNNGVSDVFEVGTGAALDCNNNFVPDECETAENGWGLDDGEPDSIWTQNSAVPVIWAVLLDAGDGTAIDGISVALTDRHGTDLAVGDPMRIFLWEDPNDDGNPSDAIELVMRDVAVEAITPANDILHPVYNNWSFPPTHVQGKFFIGIAIPGDPIDLSRDIMLGDSSSYSYPGFFIVSGDDTTAFRTAQAVPSTAEFLIHAHSLDCNDNAVPDRCDINSGALTDANNDGVADECDCFADVSGDKTVDMTDLNSLLSQWNCTGDCAADFNGDGQVNVHDLFLLLAVWGACP